MSVVPVVVLISSEDLATMQVVLDGLTATATYHQRLFNGWTDDMMRWYVVLGAIAECVRNGDISFGPKDE